MEGFSSHSETSHSTKNEVPRAILVGVYLKPQEKEQSLEHLKELEGLCETYGIESVKHLSVHLREIHTSTYLGKGKVEEITQLVAEEKIDLVIFDDEIAPHQQRNLEKALKVPVSDRTELILAVFAKRAQTKEAKLQIELAQNYYQLPRLKRMWTHLSRQRTGGSTGGGGGYLKGMGEKQIEVDRRILKKRISQLKKEIEEVKKHRQIQRLQREKKQLPCFAIVGYTNAGKSSLLNALTEAGAFVEDKLFATLDTTTRRLFLPKGGEVLLIDTVGFIRKIPHLLVASFKSTLEEAVYADILLHVVDVSQRGAEERIKETLQVLEELGAKNKPTIGCLNKIDLLENMGPTIPIRMLLPNSVPISTKTKEGLDELLTAMEKELTKLSITVFCKIPQSHYELVSEVMRLGKVLQCDYEGNDVLIKAEIPASLESKLFPYIQE